MTQQPKVEREERRKEIERTRNQNALEYIQGTATAQAVAHPLRSFQNFWDQNNLPGIAKAPLGIADAAWHGISDVAGVSQEFGRATLGNVVYALSASIGRVPGMQYGGEHEKVLAAYEHTPGGLWEKGRAATEAFAEDNPQMAAIGTMAFDPANLAVGGGEALAKFGVGAGLKSVAPVASALTRAGDISNAIQGLPLKPFTWAGGKLARQVIDSPQMQARLAKMAARFTPQAKALVAPTGPATPVMPLVRQVAQTSAAPVPVPPSTYSRAPITPPVAASALQQAAQKLGVTPRPAQPAASLVAAAQGIAPPVAPTVTPLAQTVRGPIAAATAPAATVAAAHPLYQQLVVAEKNNGKPQVIQGLRSAIFGRDLSIPLRRWEDANGPIDSTQFASREELARFLAEKASAAAPEAPVAQQAQVAAIGRDLGITMPPGREQPPPPAPEFGGLAQRPSQPPLPNMPGRRAAGPLEQQAGPVSARVEAELGLFDQGQREVLNAFRDAVERGNSGEIDNLKEVALAHDIPLTTLDYTAHDVRRGIDLGDISQRREIIENSPSFDAFRYINPKTNELYRVHAQTRDPLMVPDKNGKMVKLTRKNEAYFERPETIKGGGYDVISSGIMQSHYGDEYTTAGQMTNEDFWAKAKQDFIEYRQLLRDEKAPPYKEGAGGLMEPPATAAPEITPEAPPAAVPEAPTGPLTSEQRDANLDRFLAGAHPAMRDEHGFPKVFYHGTGAGDFEQFANPARPGDYGHGIYLTEDPKYASIYANAENASFEDPTAFTGQDNAMPRGDAGPNVKPVYVNLKNPLNIDDNLQILHQPRSKIRAAAEAAGHDGIIAYGQTPMTAGKIVEMVVFDPNAIKSATGNIGTFDASFPSLLRAGMPATSAAGNIVKNAAQGALGSGSLAAIASAAAPDDQGQPRSIQQQATDVAKAAALGAGIGALGGAIVPRLRGKAAPTTAGGSLLMREVLGDTTRELNAGLPLPQLVRDMFGQSVTPAQYSRAVAIKMINGTFDAAERANTPQGAIDAAEAIVENATKQSVRKHLPDVNEFAASMQRLASDPRTSNKNIIDWYENTWGRLEPVFGKDTELIMHTLAITSLQNTVSGNVTHTLKAYAQWKAGGVDAIDGMKTFGVTREVKKLYRDWEATGGFQGVAGAGVSPASRKRTQFVDSFKEGYMRFLGNYDPQRQMQMILTDPQWRQYMRSVSATPDMWEMRGFGFPDRPTTQQFDLVRGQLMDAAAHLGTTPRQLQAVHWFDTILRWVDGKLVIDPAVDKATGTVTGWSQSNMDKLLSKGAYETIMLPQITDAQGKLKLDYLQQISAKAAKDQATKEATALRNRRYATEAIRSVKDLPPPPTDRPSMDMAFKVPLDAIKDKGPGGTHLLDALRRDDMLNAKGEPGAPALKLDVFPGRYTPATKDASPDAQVIRVYGNPGESIDDLHERVGTQLRRYFPMAPSPELKARFGREGQGPIGMTAAAFADTMPTYGRIVAQDEATGLPTPGANTYYPYAVLNDPQGTFNPDLSDIRNPVVRGPEGEIHVYTRWTDPLEGDALVEAIKTQGDVPPRVARTMRQAAPPPPDVVPEEPPVDSMAAGLIPDFFRRGGRVSPAMAAGTAMPAAPPAAAAAAPPAATLPPPAATAAAAGPPPATPPPPVPPPPGVPPAAAAAAAPPPGYMPGISPRLISAVGGRGGKIAASAALGSGVGALAPADTEEQRQANINQGALISGGLAAGYSSRAATNVLLAAPIVGKLGGRLLKDALVAQKAAMARPSKGIRGTLGNLNQMASIWKVQATTTLRNLLQDEATARLWLSNAGVRTQMMNDNHASLIDLYNRGVRDPYHALPVNVTTKLDALGRTGVVPDVGASFQDLNKGIIDTLSARDLATAGAALSQLNPLQGGIPVGGMLIGAGKEYIRPFQQYLFETLNNFTRIASRYAAFEDTLDKELPDLGKQFLDVLEARGGNKKAIANLRTRDGYFAPAEVEAIFGGSGDVWKGLTDNAVVRAQDRAKKILGDFKVEAFPGEHQVGKVIPFISYAVRAYPRTAQMMLQHPGISLVTMLALTNAIHHGQQQGLPGYLAGSIPIDQDTPVVGGLASALGGGAPGKAYLDPLSISSPVGAELLGGGDMPQDATAYQTATNLLGRTGFSPNPLIQQAAFMLNQDYRSAPALSRTAAIEQVAPGPELPSLTHGPSNYIRKIFGGSPVSITGLDRQKAEVFYRLTGRAMNDPEVTRDPRLTALLQSASDPNSPLSQQALREEQNQATAKTIVGTSSPFQVAGRSDTQLTQDASRVADRALPPALHDPAEIRKLLAAPDLNSHLRALKMQKENQGTQATPGPTSSITSNASATGRAYLALEAWQRQNVGLKQSAPQTYARAEEELRKLLGI